MKIYTKTGDKGNTSLLGGERVPKFSLRIETYGTVDELNSIIGICRAINRRKRIDSLLYRIQCELFTLGTELATPVRSSLRDKIGITREKILQLEKQIDYFSSQLLLVRYFVLPAGSYLSSLLHFARTVCRRAERLTSKLMCEEEIGELPLIYLNRLSDLFFVLARWVNNKEKIKDEIWQTRKNTKRKKSRVSYRKNKKSM